MTALRYIDLVLVVLSAPIAVLLGAPALGTLAGAAVWVLQRVAALALERAAKRQGDVRQAVGLNLAGVFGRAWLVGLTILAVGLAGDREDGLAAAVLIMAAFTIYFATSLLVSMLERNTPAS